MAFGQRIAAGRTELGPEDGQYMAPSPRVGASDLSYGDKYCATETDAARTARPAPNSLIRAVTGVADTTSRDCVMYVGV